MGRVLALIVDGHALRCAVKAKKFSFGVLAGGDET
jgi:hypothetical protein